MEPADCILKSRAGSSHTSAFASVAALEAGQYCEAVNWPEVGSVFHWVEALGLALFETNAYLLAVEIAPILLLAAVIGAIVLVREK